MNKTVSPIFWLWIPIVALGVQLILEFTIDGNTLSLMHSENGPHEIIQALIALAGFIFSTYVLLSGKLKKVLLKIWYFLASLGCFYVAGEEVSWGQHLLDWSTPEFWSEVNDQQETNLHNTSSWLDQKPRLILLVGIIFGTLIYPFLKVKNWLNLPKDLDFLFPPKELSVIALIVIGTQIVEKFFEIFNIYVFARYSEVQEVYMFYFVLLYLIMLYQKVIKLQKT